MFGKTNKSVPAVAENDDVMRVVSYDDLLAGDVFVGKNGEAYEVDDSQRAAHCRKSDNTERVDV